MPQGDNSKEACFNYWVKGKSLKEIQRRSTAQERTIRDWIRDWERGKQKKWEVNIAKSKKS